jgi:acetoin utilization deacetylase AcuC-like enzyme
MAVGGHAVSSAQRLIRRQWRRLRTKLHPPKVRLIYDPAYERVFPGVPMDPQRADRILAFLANEHLIRRNELSLPRAVALKSLLLAHSPQYLESVQRPETLTSIFGVTVDEGEIEELLDRQRVVVGGTVQASRWALATGASAVNLGGGFHHAGRERGAGFCVFNDIAVAILRLRQRGFAEPVMVVDLDLHDGNGTREIFASDATVHTFSIHNEHWGATEAVASTSIALGPGVEDDAYLATLSRALPPVMAAFKPGLVIYLAACDSAADDKLGNWRLTADGIFARDRLVMDEVRKAHSRLIVVLGGGYGDVSWRHTARFLGWLISGTRLEPPDNEAMTLMRFREIKSTLDPTYLTVAAGDHEWQLSEEDLVGIMPGVPRQTRFLGYFSKVGVELLLERFGILHLLRIRGFERPVMQLELDHPLGQMLRICADESHREVLVELRLQRSLRAVAGCEVLLVEWLLLQNPRRTFDEQHPPLPRQHHPGLGLLGEFFGWLVVLCETLSLDGIYLRPNHYHVAVVSRRFARFIEPEAEALVRAIEAATQALPLHEAAQALEASRIVYADSGEPVHWEAWPMVVPAGAKLAERTSGETYERAVADAESRITLRLLPAPAPPGG